MDRKFGRRIWFDSRSKAFRVVSLLTQPQRREIVSKHYECYARLDQGDQGSCVRHGWAHELACEPVPVTGINHDTAVGLYYEAQKVDPWEGGEYPGALAHYEGTAVLAGAKACMMTGLIGGYYFALGEEEMALGVSHYGPAVLGTVWTSGMSSPDADGRIRPTGSVQGGHCYLIDEIDVDYEIERYWLLNSWIDYGINQRAWLSREDMGVLLKEGGEVCFALGRKEKPMSRDDMNL